MADRAPRILLADDEQAIQTLLSYPLQKDGYEVVRASDGREALARFSEQPFDLVVLDVMMPRLDGFEVCRRLKANPATRLIHRFGFTRADKTYTEYIFTNIKTAPLDDSLFEFKAPPDVKVFKR